MNRRALLTFLAGSLLCMAAPPRVSDATLTAIEQKFDQRIRGLEVDDPFELLGYTRGIYLEGFGAVFTNEINLAIVNMSPFGPTLTPEYLEKLRQKKLARLARLREVMRDLLVTSGTMLKSVPPEEQVVVGTSLFYFNKEHTKDLPARIVMQTKRQVLTDFETGKIKLEQLTAAIQEQVY